MISRSESLAHLSLKYARNLSENFLSYTWVRIGIGRLDDAFLGVLELEASPVEDKPLQQKDKKRRKNRQKKN